MEQPVAKSQAIASANQVLEDPDVLSSILRHVEYKDIARLSCVSVGVHAASDQAVEAIAVSALASKDAWTGKEREELAALLLTSVKECARKHASTTVSPSPPLWNILCQELGSDALILAAKRGDVSAMACIRCIHRNSLLRHRQNMKAALEAAAAAAQPTAVNWLLWYGPLTLPAYAESMLLDAVRGTRPLAVLDAMLKQRSIVANIDKDVLAKAVSEADSPAALSKLVAAGALDSCRTNMLFMNALFNRRQATLDFMLEQRHITWSVVTGIIIADEPVLLEKLLAAGMRPRNQDEAVDALITALKHTPKTLPCLLQYRDIVEMVPKDLALLVAVEAGDTAILENLLAAGAAARQPPEALEKLLMRVVRHKDAAAILECLFKHPDFVSAPGGEVLLAAVMAGNPAVLEKLLAAGVRPHIRYYAEHMLVEAVRKQVVLDCLLRHRSIVDSAGGKALLVAVEEDNIVALEKLLTAGVGLGGYYSREALVVALEKPDILDSLLRHRKFVANADGGKAVVAAVEGNKLVALRKLLAVGVELGDYKEEVMCVLQGSMVSQEVRECFRVGG